MENNEAFLGQGWSFPPAFFPGGAGVVMVSGYEDIEQSLQILMATSLGERVMFPNYGCDLAQYVFAEIGQELVNSVTSTVSDAILVNEPRVKVDSVKIDHAQNDIGLLLISVTYTIRTTNSRHNMVYPFYLNEASI